LVCKNQQVEVKKKLDCKTWKRKTI